MRDEVAMAPRPGAHLALPHLEVGLKVGGALGVDAHLVRLLPERLALDARRPALRAHGRLALERAHLHAGRHRIGHVAVRPAHAADEAAARLGRGLHHQVLAALGARAHARIRRHGIADGLAQIVLVPDELVQHTGEQRARVLHHVLLGIAPLRHGSHILIEFRGHVGRGHAGRVARECVHDGHAELARLERIVFEVAHLLQALDDACARGLGAEPPFLHLLHQTAPTVARRRLGLLGLELDIVHVNRIALRERRQLLIALEAIGIGLAEASIHQHVSRSRKGLAGNVQRDLGVLDGGGAHERGQEASRDQVVELLLATVQALRIALPRGVNGRVVRGLGLAACGLHRTGEHLLAHRGERRRACGQPLHDTLEVERARVDGVVHAGVRDEARHVEALRDTHGTCGADALGRRGGLQGGGVERHRRGLLAAPLIHRGHRGGRGVLHVAVCRLGLVAHFEAHRRVADLELLASAFAHAANLPVVLRHKGQTLALALNHQSERGRLHAARGAHVAKAAELGERQIAREHGAPDEVDVLAALAGVGQVVIELHQMLEGLRHLALDKRGVPGALGGNVGCHLAYHVERVGTDELALAVEVRGDDHFVGFLGEVLENADDLFLGGLLDDGSPGEVGQALDLPALDIDAILEERFALGIVGWARQAVRYVGGKYLAVLRHAVPALLLVEEDRLRKVRCQDVAGKAHGNPFLAVHGKAVDLRVVDLVGLGLAGG